MSDNKEIEKLTGYHREAAKMAAFTSVVKQPDCSQLTEERLKALLDACDHSKSSYAEEAASEDLRELREKFEQSQKEHCEVLHKLQEQHDAEMRDQAKENRFNRVCNVIAILIAAASMFISLVK